ncbi:MAG: hypothetical protein ACREVG_16730 [Burkholderiales bacterium]
MRERIAAAFGSEGSVQVAEVPGGGVSIALRLPLA